MNISYYITEDTFPQKACIIPSANEDPDILHNIAIQLPHITNPCIIFSEEVKEGKYDELSEEEKGGKYPTGILHHDTNRMEYCKAYKQVQEKAQAKKGGAK